jgi:hypothetical protein
MKTSLARFCLRLGLGSAGLMLASCALPPDQAWRVIKRDGLIPYLAMEINHKQPQQPSRYIGQADAAPAKPNDQSKAVMVQVNPPPTPVLVNRSAATTTTIVAPTSGRPLKPQARSAAEALATTPTRVAPAPVKKAPESVVKAPTLTPKVESKPAIPAPAKKPEPKPEVAAKPAPAPLPTPKPSAPAAENKAAAPAPAKTSVATIPTTTKSEDLPYGTPVTGRPGLVNSPYAGKMQLVDVTGLKPGQEVKCPYSGKLFRVPPGATATAKQAADAPEKK